MTASTDHQDRLVRVARAHAAAEAAGDLAGTMATLEDNPVYEFQPAGLLLRGGDLTRRYYEHFFTGFMPLTHGSQLRAEWVTEEGLGQEYTVQVRHADGMVRGHSMIGILVFGRKGLAGERVYAGEDVLRLMLGPLYDELPPVPA